MVSSSLDLRIEDRFAKRQPQNLMALIDCPECNHRVSDQALACPSCGFGIAMQRTVPASLPFSPQPALIRALKCPCCGADANASLNECNFCGSALHVMATQRHIGCVKCGSDLLEGQSFCEACGTLQFMNEHIQTRAEKLRFSQQKLRDSFHPEICKLFDDDEFIHAHTSGPKRYYVLSDRKLYVGLVNVHGTLGQKHEISALLHTIDLSRATRVTQWSNIHYARHDEFCECPLMTLQVETFEKEFSLTAFASAARAPFYADPHYFEGKLEDVFENIQNKTITYEEAMWRARTIKNADTPPP